MKPDADELKKYFILDQSNKNQIDFINEISKIGLDFLTGKNSEEKYFEYVDDEKLKKMVAEDLPQDGMSLNTLLEKIKNEIVKYSISPSSPRFIAYPSVANSVATIAADILISFLNQNLIILNPSGKSATFIEIQVLLWLRKLIGYKTSDLKNLTSLSEVGAAWTYGGNLSNYTAVLIALNEKYPSLRQQGLIGLKKKPAIILTAGVEHFSIADAASTLGLGSDALIYVEHNENFMFDLAAAEREIRNCPVDKQPFMLVCYAGNSRTCNIDNIKKCAELCKKYNLWLHVDACHGGSLLFSDKMRKKLAGISLADSVSLDPHKGLFVTYPCSYVVFKDPKVLARFSKYPDSTERSGMFDLGLITPFFGSKGFHSLKLWMLIKHLGKKGLAAAVEARYELNLLLINKIKQAELFVFLNDNDFYKSVFVYCPTSIRKIILSVDSSAHEKIVTLINKYNKILVDQLYKKERIIFDLVSLYDAKNRVGLGMQNKYWVLSMIVGHAVLDGNNINMIVDDLMRAGKYLEKYICEDVTGLNLQPIEQALNNRANNCSNSQCGKAKSSLVNAQQKNKNGLSPAEW